MIAVKYVKLGAARYISHIDILRHIVRTLRRAEIKMGFSEGFNPHMLLKLSIPCPLGIGSNAEYFAASAEGVSAEEFLKRYNACCIKGMEALNAWETKDNPNFQGVAVWADYDVPVADSVCITDIQGIMDRADYIVDYENKGKLEKRDLRPMIGNISAEGRMVIARLAAGNVNLRADRVAAAWNKDFNAGIIIPEIMKTAQYALIGGRLVDFDSMLNNRK